jgi:CTP:molybdopterin cytidylyltransferase MocA
VRVSTDAVDAIVLAGGVNRIQLYDGYVPGYKALLEFGGRPSIRYTLDALAAVPRVKRVCIVGSEPDLREAVCGTPGASRVDSFVTGGDTMLQSVVAGLERFQDSPMVLVVTADMPLITPRAIDDFLDGCARIETPYSEHFVLSVVPEDCFTGRYRTAIKAPNRFRGVTVCHGNLFLADPRLLCNEEAMARLNGIYASRKSQFRSALAVGLGVGLSYVVGVRLLHIITIDQLSRIVSRRFGIGIRAVSLPHPGITVDVDEPSDYAFVTSELEPASAGQRGAEVG